MLRKDANVTLRKMAFSYLTQFSKKKMDLGCFVLFIHSTDLLRTISILVLIMNNFSVN